MPHEALPIDGHETDSEHRGGTEFDSFFPFALLSRPIVFLFDLHMSDSEESGFFF